MLGFIGWFIGILILLIGLFFLSKLFLSYKNENEDFELSIREKIDYKLFRNPSLTGAIIMCFIGAWMSGYLSFLAFLLLASAIYIVFKNINLKKIKDDVYEKDSFSSEKLTNSIGDLGEKFVNFLKDPIKFKKNIFVMASSSVALLIILFNIGADSLPKSQRAIKNICEDKGFFMTDEQRIFMKELKGKKMTFECSNITKAECSYDVVDRSASYFGGIGMLDYIEVYEPDKCRVSCDDGYTDVSVSTAPENVSRKLKQKFPIKFGSNVPKKLYITGEVSFGSCDGLSFYDDETKIRD